jgi:hypothetical protein
MITYMLMSTTHPWKKYAPLGIVVGVIGALLVVTIWGAIVVGGLGLLYSIWYYRRFKSKLAAWGIVVNVIVLVAAFIVLSVLIAYGLLVLT